MAHFSSTVLVKNSVNTLTRGLFFSLFITLLTRVDFRQAESTTPHLRHHPRALEGRSLSDSKELAKVGKPRNELGPGGPLNYLTCGLMSPPSFDDFEDELFHEDYRAIRTTSTRSLPTTNTVPPVTRLTQSLPNSRASSQKLEGAPLLIPPSPEKSKNPTPALGWPLRNNRLASALFRRRKSAKPDSVPHGSKPIQEPISSAGHSEDTGSPVLSPRISIPEGPQVFAFHDQPPLPERRHNAQASWWYPVTPRDKDKNKPSPK